jgi:hypothetical protein
MLQPLLLLKQTLDVSYDPGVLLLDGANVKFTTFDQILSRAGSHESSFSVGLQLNGVDTVTTTYGLRSTSPGIEVDSVDIVEGGFESVFKPNMTSEQISKALPQSVRREFNDLMRGRRRQWQMKRDRCFIYPVLSFGGDGDRSLSSFGVNRSFARLASDIRDVTHVPALRGNPLRLYPTTSTTAPFPGTFDNYVASIIWRWQTDKDANLRNAWKDLLELGLTWKVEARRRNETQIELLVGRLPRPRRGGSRDLVSIADVGFGVSQSLPVIVALLAARPGQLLYIEEPEIHLHPMAQHAMAGLAVKASARGVRVVLETHSSLILRGIQTAIAKKELQPDQVALHWFSRPEATGATRVSTADVEADGSFGDWPVDFDRVTLAAEREYLDA